MDKGRFRRIRNLRSKLRRRRAILYRIDDSLFIFHNHSLASPAEGMTLDDAEAWLVEWGSYLS